MVPSDGMIVLVPWGWRALTEAVNKLPNEDLSHGGASR